MNLREAARTQPADYKHKISSIGTSLHMRCQLTVTEVKGLFDFHKPELGKAQRLTH